MGNQAALTVELVPGSRLVTPLYFQMTTPSPLPPTEQTRNPLHGKTLQSLVEELEACYGWAGLAEQIPIRCFALEPSVNSSLKFLRKTPWAREKVESLYLFMLREIRRSGGSPRR